MSGKLIGVLILTIPALFFCPADKVKNDLVAMNLKGKIKVITAFGYGISKYKNGVPITHDTGKIEKVFFEKNVTKFNTLGNLIEEDNYSDKALIGREIYHYDTLNNQREKLSYYGTANIWGDKLVSKYDANRNLIEENYYGRDKSIKNAPAVHTAQIFYRYDKERNLADRDWITITDTFYSHSPTAYKYDEHNNLIEWKTMYPESGIPDVKTEFKYDEQNNKIEENYFSSEGEIYTTRYKYDELGNEMEKNETNSKTSSQQKSTHKYSYDKMGNWVTDTFNRYDNFNVIYERKIEYYK